MYLKSLEMSGFKSFADKTKLEFLPGMTAIVGPNGCGKSNIADAVRWVIGEQSAKAMRGSAMTDCIFNGTDDRKPLGMAEVSITMTECEDTLGTDYHEVTITRRVFRSGEGQYFINKTPCRLKDIQRLFMDTGIGTTSYSLMEQGRIDRVLSSRPEDRRAIFEEASGITKFKADKKEAIRKLEQTEANLLRLADVIREVKRQIGSLQRQAGKARRYKELRDELRKLDILSSRERLKQADQEIKRLETEISGLTGKIHAAHREVEDLEEANAGHHEALMRTEREIAALQEAGMHAQSELDRTQDLVRMNQQRIEEYKEWSARDTLELGETQRLFEAACTELEALATRHGEAIKSQAESKSRLDACASNFEEHKGRIDTARARIQRLREESVELESLGSRLQNQIVEIETRERAAVIQRERLAAEKGQLAQVLAGYERRQQEMAEALTGLQAEVAQAESRLQILERELVEKNRLSREIMQHGSELERQAAARRAQIDVLRDAQEAEEDFPGGARLLLDESNPLAVDRGALRGTLAEAIDVDPDYGPALEAVLRPWLDAVLVANTTTATAMLAALEKRRAGPVRLLTLDAPPPSREFPAPVEGAEHLIEHVRSEALFAPLFACLLGHVYVVDSCERIPEEVPPGVAYVTRGGVLVRGGGQFEFWMTDSRAANPLSRKNALAQAEASLGALEREIGEKRVAGANLQEQLVETQQAIVEARTALDAHRRRMAQKEGEAQVIGRETKQARDRLETVTWELDDLNARGESSDSERERVLVKQAEIKEQRERLLVDIQAQSKEQHVLENRYNELQTELTEFRIAHASHSQRVEHLASQLHALTVRRGELDATLKGRSRGLESYQANIEKLSAEIAGANERLTTLEEDVSVNRAKMQALRKQQDAEAARLREQEVFLAQRRAMLEEFRNAKSGLDVRLAESRMRRQNLVDHVTSEYNVTLKEVTDDFDIKWEDEVPSLDFCETRVAELRTKIDAMGPVNLVAIEEYKELEERCAFLTGQENDLVTSKQQLMDMIRKINRTTSEMFRTTFDQVNTNFLDMFKKLFNGGTAQLVLVNEDDVLECGIEIIARPPGKRLQNISLLSGGERTLTAVALLFAIYMIKPSPFCLLDELDAPLDDSNIGRFIEVLLGFLGQSQFMIITHNQHTISAADVLYGVTMPNKGISRIVSMKLEGRDALPRQHGLRVRPKMPGPAEEAEAPGNGE